jgi:lauroyl/myristoyl acyltransferase
LLKIVAWSLAQVGLSSARRFGRALGLVARHLLISRTRHVAQAVAAAGLPRSTVAAFYRSLGTSLGELLWAAGAPAVTGARGSLAQFSAAAEQVWARVPKPAVIVAAHTGNWEFAAYAFAETEPLTLLVRTQSVSWANQFIARLRARLGVQARSGPGAVRGACQDLRAGRHVVIVQDQAPQRSELTAEFLGQVAALETMPARLAMLSKRPLVVIASARSNVGHQTVDVLGVIEPPRTGALASKRQWVREATLEANALLDGFVREHPSEWLWLHRRWKRASNV